MGLPGLASSARADDQEARQILKRAIEAVGGRFGRLQGPVLWMERGTYYGNGDSVPFVTQYASRWPDWFRQEVEGVFTITVSGKKAWLTNDEGVRIFTGAALEEAMKQNRMRWASKLFPLTDKAYTLNKIEGIQIDGRPTVGIEASHADGGEFKLYFDKETYLITKMEAMVITPMLGPDPVLAETYYSAHRSLGGAKVPSNVKIHYDRKLVVEAEIVASKVGATLDPALFEVPKLQPRLPPAIKPQD